MPGTLGTRTGRVRVLIVDDEPALTELPAVAVIEARRRPSPAADGQSALRVARGCTPHSVVLDGMLPDLDGLQVLRRPRYENPKPPVLMLTARDAPGHRFDRFDRFEAGADDMVTKPYSLPSRTQILGHVRHDSFDAGGNLVEAHISNPRRKIDRSRVPVIHTVRGPGYAIRSTEAGR